MSSGQSCVGRRAFSTRARRKSKKFCWQRIGRRHRPMSSCPVVLDPALLTFSRSLGREEFVARVRFLAEWAGLARSGEVQIHIAAEVRNFLIRNGYFPAHEAVADAIECLDLRFR